MSVPPAFTRGCYLPRLVKINEILQEFAGARTQQLRVRAGSYGSRQSRTGMSSIRFDSVSALKSHAVAVTLQSVTKVGSKVTA